MNELEEAARDAVNAFRVLVDNAGGYDRSNLRNAILEVDRLHGSLGAWSKEDLLAAEERARQAWKRLADVVDRLAP